MSSIAFLDYDETLYETEYDEINDVFYDDDEMDDSFVLYADEEEKIHPSGNCTAWEAFVYSINREGRINLRYMSEISGLSVASLIEQLEGKVMWRDHASYNPLLNETEVWVTKEQYIRENVFEMLDEVKRLHKKTGLFEANIELLKSIKPAGPLKEEIEVTPGVSWFPKQYMEQFMAYITGMDGQPELEYDDYKHKWKLKKACPIKDARRNTAYFGTDRMSALQILLHIMNVIEIRLTKQVHDYVTGKDKYELDEEATMAALDKRDLILEEFKRWLKMHPAIMKDIQRVYTKTFGYTVCKYDVPILSFPGLNPKVVLYANQKGGIARIILSPNNVLISHSVGAGKTYILEIGIFERIRMGLSKKALFVMPNQVLDDADRSFRFLYPDCPIVTIYPEEFNEDHEAALQKMKLHENSIILIAESSFNMIDMTKEYYLKVKEEKIRACRKYLSQATQYYDKKSREDALKKLVEDYKDFDLNYIPTELNCFEELGVDLLVVDECHRFKNVTIEDYSNTFTGSTREGSNKADLLVHKCEHIREKEGKLVFATGTPLDNSLADLYVLQKYLQPEALEVLKISKFHEWLNTFCHQTSDYEVAVNTNYLVMKTRFTRFHNLPELMALFSQVSDSYEINGEEFDLPDFAGYENIVVKKSQAQEEEFKKILKRSREIHLGRVRRKDDNMLKVTNDGRLCSLDVRLVRPEIKVSMDDETKASVCAKKILEIRNAYPDRTQAVFCDTSTPKKAFNIYDEMVRQLTYRGFQRKEIAFIHDGTTKEKRRKLMDDFNKGIIKVLIGSTQKMGIGVNIQKKLVALHHLDAPWKPADMIQRDGRGIRQGNTSERIFVYRYVTEGSFDAYMWQILENKQKFIASFLSGTMSEEQREQDDIGRTVLTYAEVKALAIGNPLIKKRVEYANDLERYRMSQRRKRKELIEVNNFLSSLPKQIEKHKKWIEDISADISYYEENKTSMTEAARSEFGEELLYALALNKMQEKESVFDWYQEFEIILPANMTPDKPYVYVRRDKDSQRHQVMMEKSKPLGCCMRLDYMLNHLPDRKKRLEDKLSVLLEQQKEAKEQLLKGNPYDALIEETKLLLEEIDKELKEEKIS